MRTKIIVCIVLSTLSSAGLVFGESSFMVQRTSTNYQFCSNYLEIAEALFDSKQNERKSFAEIMDFVNEQRKNNPGWEWNDFLEALQRDTIDKPT